MFPIQRLDRPKTCRVSNGDTENPLKLEIDIPIAGDVDVNERQTVQGIIEKNGLISLEPVILEIANEVAQHNGNNHLKITTQLLDLRKMRGDIRYDDPVEEYRSYFLHYCRDKFNDFEQKLISGDIDRYELAAGAFVMLKRATKTGEFDPAKLKIEHLMDTTKMPSQLLLSLYHLYLVEKGGSSDIRKYLDKDGYFSIKHFKDTDNQKTEQEEPTEVLAGKS